MSAIFEAETNVEAKDTILQAQTGSASPTLILIVEDSDDIRALLSELLEDEGYRVVTASNGEDGLKAAQVHYPQLILMDLSLPGMDGWETVRNLRRLPDFAQTPIVALTAHATKRDEERALAAGCTGYISKPFDADRLLTELQAFVPGSPDQN